MSYRPAPYAGELVDLPRYTGEELQRIATNLEQLTEAVRQLVAYRIIGGVSDRWLWDDTSTTMGDPGAGYVRGDSNNLGGTSSLALSSFDAFGRDLRVLSPAEGDLEGEFIFLELVGGNYVQGLVQTVTENAGWTQLDLVNVSGSGNPGQDEVAEFIWYPSQTLLTPEVAAIVGRGMDWRRLVADSVRL